MPASRQSFYISIPDLASARGKIDSLSFNDTSADSFAAQLQAALREPVLWQRWKSMQPDPDAVDPMLGASDAQATVAAQQADLHCDAQVTTVLPHVVLKHRLGLLIGAHWTLRDVHSV
jgi:hypothetical protein